MFKNEEDIRSKLLMPYLEDLGFDVSEISLEKSFSIRLGKNKHHVGGRSDILCKRNGKNLFIIELKNDSLSISQEDIDQGISYARLLDNIAPFTIISNGKETKIFDTVSKKELTGTNISEQSVFWQHDCTLSTDEDLRIRYAALKNFISFSDTNLKIFCETQVKDRMSPITGTIDDPKAKFVKKLHIQREVLHNIFGKFIDSEASVFGIVGNAGVGKTGSMCSLALNGLDGNFVFFYNAALIDKSPAHYISQDLNLFFSGKTDNEIVLKKLNELGGFLNKKILIFIDAIDESLSARISLDLSEIAYAAGKLDNIKICISCKSNIWGRFLHINDTKTHLYEELEKFHNILPDLDNNPGFFLKNFNDEEIFDIISLYRHTFGFKGQISESLLNELRNGFFLRIFSEVYSDRQVPEAINDVELIKKYIIQSLEKTNIGVQSGLRILSKIGEVLVNQKFNDWKSPRNEDSIEIDILLEDLNLSIDQNLPEDLFARNILMRSNDADSLMVSFYYSKIRDFIICYHSFKLDKINDEKFDNILHIFFENHIGQSAIDFYLDNANTLQKDIYKRVKKTKLINYAVKYDNFLNEHFGKIKKCFNPYTEGEIGIIIPDDLIEKDGFSLCPIEPNNKRKYKTDSFDGYMSAYENSIFKKGGSRIHSSSNSLLVKHQDQIVEKSCYGQLMTIVKEGKLNDYEPDILLIEKVSNILYFYYKKLSYNYNIQDYHLPRYDLIYPIDLKELKEGIYKLRASYYYRGQNKDRTLVDRMIANAIKEKLEIPKVNVVGDGPPFEELDRIVDKLLEKGYHKIKNHYLPCPDISLSEVKSLYPRLARIKKPKEVRCSQFSERQANLYIHQFFEYLERSYKEIVEYYFPVFKEQFPFYTDLPHEYFFYLHESDICRRGWFGYRTSQDGKVKVNIKKYILSKEERDGITTSRGFSLDSIIHIDKPIKTINRINTPKVDKFCVIRNWLYELLRHDIVAFLKENDYVF